jgi:MOSC domain-containing protein YiiM
MTPEAKPEKHTPEAKPEKHTPEAKPEKHTPEAKPGNQTPERDARNQPPERDARNQTCPPISQPQVLWLGVRPARDVAMLPALALAATLGRGLTGDRYTQKKGSGKREVTLITHADILTLVQRLGLAQAPEQLYPLARRNVVVDSQTLPNTTGQRFWLGSVQLECTGPCEPCQRMDLAFGAGAFAAMRSAPFVGGMTARIIEGGVIHLGDALRLERAEVSGHTPA